MNRGFDDLRSEMNGRFEAMGQRFDDQKVGVNQRLDRLTDQVSLVVGIGDRVSRNEGQIEFIGEQLRTVDALEP